MSFTVQKINTSEEFNKLERYWNDLIPKSRAKSPFITYEWMSNWWKSFRNHNELFILYIRDREDNPVGIIPLMRREEKKFGINFRYIDLIGSDESLPDYLDFIIDQSVEDSVISVVVDYFSKQADDWDIIRLSGIKEDSVCFKFSGLLSNKGYKSYEELQSRCPYIKLPETWADYLNTMSKKSRFNVRKKKRVLDDYYENSFSLLNNEESLGEVMVQLSELHRKRMAAKGINSYSSSDTFWEFQKRVAADFFRKGWLFLGTLQINGEIAACQYAFIFDQKVFHYQTGFNPIYERYSVGLISVGHMVETAINRGFREYDFLRGDEEYKFHWTKTWRKLFLAYVVNNNTKSQILLRQHILLRWIKQKIKAHGKK